MTIPSISSVQLRNFRGFRDHTVSLNSGNVLVGQNNAGKSTLIDALRLLSVASSKSLVAKYEPPPQWLESEIQGLGYKVNFDTVDFDFRNITTNLKTDAPARLQLVYSNRARLTLWLSGEMGESFAQISTPRGPVSSRKDAGSTQICPIIVMPPLGPLNPKETQISKARVREYMFGRLSSWHYRNQLYEMPSEYRAWAKLLEETWPGVQIKSFNANGGDSKKEFALILREGPFASEAAWVGSGLQAWMQILWFVCRAPKNAFVVLDEPDVFLHADMQRKIAKLVLGGGFKQSAIATHSSEIISDVEPSLITVVRKRERSSWRPGKKGQLQGVIDSLGSRHNLQLSKLASARKVALFEGEDQKFLLDAALKKNSETYHKLSSVPSFDLNGIDNWHQAIGAAKVLHASADGEIPVILVMDRDYRTDDDIASHREECRKNYLQLHCWSKKEIENFLISPKIVHRLISKKHANVTVAEVEQIINTAASDLVIYTVGAIADQWQLENRRESASSAMKSAQDIFENLCRTRPLVDVVSGKRLISAVSQLCKEKWSTSFAPMTLCRATHWEEYPDELRHVLEILTK